MSGRLTSISLQGYAIIADWGLRTPEEMIKIARDYAASLRKQAEQIEAASNQDFTVETYIGVNVMKNRKILQKGKDQKHAK
jgi:hypothetical protein